MDVENGNIGNHETQCDASIKVIDYYDNKGKLQELIERHALENCFVYKVTLSTKNLWEITCLHEQCEWQAQTIKI